MTADAAVSLDDKYEIGPGHALVAGRQALVRLPIVQRALDKRSGHSTAGYISGYRGSPLGGYDAELWKAAKVLGESDVVFHPGLNEDLALTAVAGTQQIDFVPGGTVDGVFAIWYGKGPGVDRSGDAIKHANLAGTSPLGGVVLVFGDDHAGKSSTTAHQSDLTLASWGVPILYPSSVSEVLPLGLAAIAMSRFSGALVGLKIVNETAESTGVLDLSLPQEFVRPDIAMPEGGVHIRPEFLAMQRQEARLLEYKLPRAQAFARANHLDRISFGAERPRFLIATAGKAYTDVLDALTSLGLDDRTCRDAGIGVYKIALIYPLEPDALTAAAIAATEIVFVEEKQAHGENQAKQIFFNRAERPGICGKTTPDGQPLLPSHLPLDKRIVAKAIASRINAVLPEIASALGIDEKVEASGGNPVAPPMVRRPEFCAGCPHNSSTRVPAGSIGATGIGCHGMAVFHPDRNLLPMGQMGAEGANWIGLSQFTTTPHIFQNLGDGTYSHSGSLAVRAAVQAGVNITFKILFNDAVAMTGGQPVEGQLLVADIVRQVAAEGVKRIVVLSEDPGRFSQEPLPSGTDLRHRDELDVTQRGLREEPGVSVLIFDQVCAAEKRRRRKTGNFPDPDRRVFINALVCEGCGDCSVQSNCMAIEPLKTDLGLKRRIDQSACNKDFSCKKGFCPSFVTIDGGRLHGSPKAADGQGDTLPEPQVPEIEGTFDVMIAGIGGTGVITVGAILGMAARIEGLGVNLFDMTGLSQKGGAVFSHVRFSSDRDAVLAARIGPSQSRVVIACDMVAATQPECIETISSDTLVVANGNVTATAAFQSNPDVLPSRDGLAENLARAAGRAPHVFPATKMSERLFGDSIAANMMLLGYAWQLGGIPLSRAAIEKAIELNGKSVAANLRAFEAGRSAVSTEHADPDEPFDIEAFVAARAKDLSLYWNGRYARRYIDIVEAARRSASPYADGDALIWAVARGAYKLMAYKDEYEVGRLYTDGRFHRSLAREFVSVRSVKVHLSPPLLARRDPNTGRPRKFAFGSWIFPLFKLLASLRWLRETPLDVFGWTSDRRIERALRDAYLSTMTRRLGTLSAADFQAVVVIAGAPLEVRGFGPVKEGSAQALLDRLTDTKGGTDRHRAVPGAPPLDVEQASA
ncbi:indolepyruvate ferredoxin oxidoreductase family protein [Sphingosinicella soli]|uniref:Indolepyruvate ferredoxin oxidoreductase n=1 Tax=Sphingosinicella soli TaxID=333708 RepID=A0A7W7F4X7_9SPHN|nr:indolepyruvate ferredoxin oxidoreductase family protein [Sphingosinicella soli]MBB4630815.1 indolepyruvate ferredoxin oxidoreductase [Sphingosinicella soli]